MLRFLIFSAGSIIGAAIDLLLSLAFFQLGVPAWGALGLAMFVSATLVYVFHQKLTFGDLHSRNLNTGRLTIFLANTVAVYFFRILIFYLLVGWEFSEFIALCVALVASVTVNYTISRMLIFSRLGSSLRKRRE